MNLCNNLFTDLACERRQADLSIKGIEYTKEENSLGFWERIDIKSDGGAKAIGRPKGIYDTLTLRRMDLLDFEEIIDAKEEIAGRICKILEERNITATNVLIVGLGNAELTPDAIGPMSADKVYPTMHIYRLDKPLFMELGCSKVSVIKPGVTSKSGLNSAEIIDGIRGKIMPDLIVAIDSLMARGRERLGSTVQIATSGIVAGSGLHSDGSEISENTMTVPVLSIGVPTVIDARSLSANENVGKIRGSDGLMVSPKEIGDIVKNAAEIIGGAINLVFGICG